MKKSKSDDLVSKKHLDKRLKKVTDELVNYINLRLEPIDLKLLKLNSIDQRLDKILINLDWLVGKYKKFDEEHTILTGKYSEINQRIDRHEEKIVKLEKKVI